MMKPRTHETRQDVIRHYHRLNIAISLYGMPWSSLWDKEKRGPTLRDVINRVKFLGSQWFCAEHLPALVANDSAWDASGELIPQNERQ